VASRAHRALAITELAELALACFEKAHVEPEVVGRLYIKSEQLLPACPARLQMNTNDGLHNLRKTCLDVRSSCRHVRREENVKKG
jgi:hypothetical protein